MGRRTFTSPPGHALQRRFFTAVQEQSVPVRVFLVSGTRLEGTVAAVDPYSLHLDSKRGTSFLYKSAIAAIVPLAKVRMRDEKADEDDRDAPKTEGATSADAPVPAAGDAAEPRPAPVEAGLEPSVPAAAATTADDSSAPGAPAPPAAAEASTAAGPKRASRKSGTLVIEKRPRRPGGR